MLTSIPSHSNTVTVMRILKRTTTAMIRMTTTGHNQAAIRTAMAMDPGIIIIMGIQHSETMPNSTTTTITTCGDNEKKTFDSFTTIDPWSSQKTIPHFMHIDFGPLTNLYPAFSTCICQLLYYNTPLDV